MHTMKMWNYIIAGVMACVGAAIVLNVSGMAPPYEGGDPGAGFWPRMLGGGLVLLSICLAVFNTVNGAAEKAKTFALTTSGNRMAYVFMGLTVLFCVVLYFLGFIVAGLMFVPMAMHMLGEKDKKRMAVASVLIVAGIYVVFSVLLNTPLPKPIFFR